MHLGRFRALAHKVFSLTSDVVSLVSREWTGKGFGASRNS